MKRTVFLLFVTLFVTASIAAANPKPEETWPGFRGHGMSGVAPGTRCRSKWSATENVALESLGARAGMVVADRLGRHRVPHRPASAASRSSSRRPGSTATTTSPSCSAQGLSDEEVMRRVRARDNESPEESDEIRYMVYALDAATGKIKWEQEAHKGRPSGGRHRKNTYASETPFTDGERLYVSFGQNVGLFCYSLDGKLLWKKQWPPQPIYLDFGTASSPIVHDGRVYLLHDSEADSYLTALDAKTGEELWRTARPRTGLPRSSWTTPFMWKNAKRTEIVTIGHAMVLSYDLDGKELWRVTGMSMPTASPLACERLALRRHRLAGRRQPSVPRHQARRHRRHHARRRRRRATSSSRGVIRARRATRRRRIVHDGRAYLVHDTGILAVLNAKTGQQIYKVRVGGGGHTFSASPVAAGNRDLPADGGGRDVRARERRHVQGNREERSRRDVARVPRHRRRRDLHPDGIEAV